MIDIDLMKNKLADLLRERRIIGIKVLISIFIFSYQYIN